MLQYQTQTYFVLLMTINVTLTLVVMLAACLCCKKKLPKNELLGLEGMVKLKNPDDIVVVSAVGNSESQADLNVSSISNADSEKRASTAAHRSLPDIPVAENNGDNGSELYETVADKRLLNSHQRQDKSPTQSLKQQASVSQHSSISQADDVSSPYSRVKNSPHDYAKVRATEHPYAQLNAPSSSITAVSISSQLTLNNDNMNHDILNVNRDSSQNLNEIPLQAEIPAASAIAGIIAASQDLPYMTPPIANQHFSGDSQDSSKGYTSISVREPLANILAQQPSKPLHRNPQLSRDVSDSHYATVSDDSDETYAAIEDPNARHAAAIAADIYTSGSETYAQIQPMQPNAIVVSVEINNSSSNQIASPSSSSVAYEHHHHHHSTTSAQHTTQNIIHHAPSNHKSTSELTPIPPPVDSLRAQMHSRQASSSSNNSSMGNLGSPKPEKRQANSPLPPTPKSNASQQQLQQFLASSNSNLTSGRNSIISVIECGGSAVLDSGGGSVATATTSAAVPDDSPHHRNIKSLSPSKDIEGMYAKVMKKNKFSRNTSSSSQNNSPIMTRKYNEQDATSLGVSPLDSAAADLLEAGAVLLDKSRTRSNSYNVKDHGYETIPADALRIAAGTTGAEQNRKSDCYTNILQKERQLEGASKLPNPLSYKHNKPPISETELVYRSEKDYETITAPPLGTRNSDPGYETFLNPSVRNSSVDNEKKSSEYDPNYEVLTTSKYGINITSASALSDDGYAKVLEKVRIAIDDDSTDGYSKVKGDTEDNATGGYSTINEVKIGIANNNHNYASILETKAAIVGSNSNDTDSDHYARIADTIQKPNVTDLKLNTVSTPIQQHGTSPADNESDAKPPRLPDLPITPSSLTSSSLLANSSTASSSNITSTSTLSSLQTPSSQYESLTGSDTDPNYESVCYLNTNRENPYERLLTDHSDTQQNSPITPEEHTSKVTVAEHTNVVVSSTPIKAPTGSKPSLSSSDLGETVVVDDYFQV